MTNTTAYLCPDSRSAAAFARARRVVAGGVSRTTIFREPYPPVMAYGRGSRLVDVDGEERTDFLNNYTALIHGHAHPVITERIAKAAGRGTAYSFPCREEAELAEHLVARLPGAERVRFTNSGTEAVMLAIRLARAATGRDRIAKFEGCYHGAYDEARVSESASLEALGPADRPASVPERGLSRGSPEAVLALPFNRAELAIPLIEAHAHDLAAVLVDPAPNRAGLAPASPAFLCALREVTARLGIVLIFDEVITFRVGPGGIQAEQGVEPDLTTLGKIIGGGLPVGAVAGLASILDLTDPSGVAPIGHGGTFNGNPLTMAAGLASMDLLQTAVYERLGALAVRLGQAVEATTRAAGLPCSVRVVGSLFQVHLREEPVTDYRDLIADAAALARGRVFSAELLGRGIVLSPNGLGCTSSVMDDADIDTFVEAAATAAGAAYERVPAAAPPPPFDAGRTHG